jgi:flagellar basal-body rod protein FlgB
MLDNIGLFKGMTGKMSWLNDRQVLVSQNVANADTPGYVPSDLKEVDFGAIMAAAQNKPKIAQAATQAGHINTGATLPNGKPTEQRVVYEAAPDGENAVVLEEQLLKAQKTSSDYQLMVNLYRKNIGMIKVAIGKA